MAATGPPPGLDAPSSPPRSSQFLPGRLTRGTGPRYGRSLLLKLASSPLVPQAPDDMPAFEEWFGAWEPYTPKQHHPYHHGSQQSGPMGSFNQTSRGNRDGGAQRAYHQRDDGALADSNHGLPHQGLPGGGFLGVRRRDGEQRENTRYRKNDDRDGAEGAQRYGNASRYPTGKNPFGQVSSTGAFRPAGKDLESPTGGKFPMGRMSREERPRRRTEGMPDADDGGEWETVPRSPEADRKMARQAATVADSAADWRRGPGGGALPKKGVDGMRGPRTGGPRSGDDARRGGPSGSFPAWMAEESEPSWMNDESPAPSTERRERGKLNFDAFKGSENIHVVPREGEDSIQAFKREMRERERRAREAEGGGAEDANERDGASRVEPEAPASRAEQDATPLAQGPPPGLSRPSATSASQDDGPEQAKRPTTDAQPTPARGSSRFARFFDGAAATNKAKEAQEKALAAHNAAHAAPAAAQPPPAAASQPSPGIETLFRNMGMDAAGGQKEPASEADAQSMQKIMAMLRGGGGGATAGGDGNRERDATPAASSPGPQQAAAGLMAMLAGGGGAAREQEQDSRPRNEQPRPSSPQQSRPSGGASAPPPGLRGPSGGRASPSQPYGGRSQSPSVGFNAPPYGMGPPPGFAGPASSPGGQMPPFGMDPRLMGNRGPPPPGLSPGATGYPPHLGGGGATPPPGAQRGGGGGGGGGGNQSNNNGNPLYGLPPHVQQQLMGLPPHVQHSILSGGGPMPPPPPGPHQHQHYGGPPPPPGFMPHGAGPGSPYGRPSYPVQHVGPYAQQQQQQHYQQQHPHQQQQQSGNATGSPGPGGMPGLMYGQAGGR